MQSAINLCELVVSGYHLTRDFEWPGIDLNFLKTNFCLNILNLEHGNTREKAKLSLVCLKCEAELKRMLDMSSMSLLHLNLIGFHGLLSGSITGDPL
jgi:hypothetical protein